MRQRPITRFYEIRPHASGWARIWITSDGAFSCLSDWGNYGYWWGGAEGEFRKFLLECDVPYLAGKLGGGKSEYDPDATTRVIRAHILSKRRNREHFTDRSVRYPERERYLPWDKFTARAEWNAAARLHDERDLEPWREHSVIEDPSDMVCYGPPRRVQLFLQKIWPSFMEQLKAELSQEQEQAATAHSANA